MAHWVHDGASYFEIDGALVKHKPDPQEKNPSNAMWVDGDGVSSGSHYWKINFATLEGVSGFGLTSKERFKRGFECNGLMLIHGDLCHGGPDGCLVKGFGPRSEEGNTVGIVARFDDKNLNVYFDVNGKSLGAAFVTPKTIFTSIFPMVRFFSEGSATCTKQTELPKILKRPVPDTSGIEGEWKLKMLKENDVEAKIVISITCKIEKRGENIYDWIITASKSFRTKLIWVNGKLETTPIISDTRILAPTGQKFESSLKELMHDVNTVENNNGSLSANSETLKSTWRRNDPTFKPFNGNPFGQRV